MSTQISRQEALQVLQSLLRIRTALPAGDEMDCVKYILSLFPADKITSRILEHGHNRASLKISIPGQGRKNLAIVGHMDTISVPEPELWNHSPFGADVEEDLVYGLGATNMKGGLTSMILAALGLIRSGSALPLNLHLCFSADEEVNGIGAGALLRSGLMDDMDEIIVAEPTTMKVGLAEKGALWLHLTIHGKSCHSAMPSRGTSAVEAFLELTRRIRELFADEHPHRLLGHSTCEITEIHAGTAPNLLPGLAQGTLDLRILPTVNHYTLLETIKKMPKIMEQKYKDLSITINSFNFQAPVGMNRNAPMVQRVKEIYEQRSMRYEEIGIHSFTDASRLIPTLGVPFVIMGPGEHELGYQIDEKVSLSSVCEMAEVYRDYVLSQRSL